jgi:hypothetical protein
MADPSAAPERPRPIGNLARWYEREWNMSEGSLLGAVDIAVLLGVSRQRVSQLKRADPTFPPSGLGTREGVRLWRRAGIEAWAAMHRPARAEAGGRFAGDAAALLLAAERIAAEARHWWVDSAHVWTAACRGEVGRPLVDTLASLGITAAEPEALFDGMRGTDERPRHTLGMTPRFQTFLARADRRAAKDGRDRVTAVDILLAFVDAPRDRDQSGRMRPEELVLNLLERRGLDLDELRRRLLAVEADAGAVSAFEVRRLRRQRRARARERLPGVELAPNPLGHDPRARHPWGSAFGRTRDGRSLVIDGEQWFFTIDGDGFFIRTADGRPIGYRWRVRPKPRRHPVSGTLEVLPMPPVELADWPDHRFGPSG